MRALLRGERQGSVGVVAGLLAVMFLGISSMGLNWKQYHDLRDVKATLIGRCELRQAADAREREDLQARIDLYAAIISTEQRNQFIDDTLRAQRIGPYRDAMVKAQATLDGMPAPVDCERVYATGR